MYVALGIKIRKYSLYFLKYLSIFLFSFSVYFVVGLIQKLKTLGDLGNVHEGVLNKLTHDELVFGVEFDLFECTQNKNTFGFQPTLI